MYAFIRSLSLFLTHRYQLRVEALQLKMEFYEKLEDLRPAVATLEGAIDELLSCAKLSEVFHVALMAGNFINGVCWLA